MTMYNLKSISHNGEFRGELPNFAVSLNCMELFNNFQFIVFVFGLPLVFFSNL